MKTKTPAMFFWCIWAAIACPLCLAEEPKSEQEQPPKTPPMMKVCTLQKLQPDEVAQAVHSLGVRVRVGINRTTNSVVLAGPEEEVQAALKIIGELDALPVRKPREAEEDRRARTFKLTFFLLEGSFDPQPSQRGTPPPERIAPAAKALEECGLYDLHVLTPVIAACERGEKLSTFGSLPFRDATREVRVHATPEVGSESGMVELQLAVQVTEMTAGGGSELFNLSTTVSSNLGDYVVIGASPVKGEPGQALALILRVDARE